MEKLEEKLNNLDTIIETIKQNSFFKKYDQGSSLEQIVKLSNTNKHELENKLDKIEKFTDLLEDIIKKKPNPSKLNTELSEYIQYEKYYNNEYK